VRSGKRRSAAAGTPLADLRGQQENHTMTTTSHEHLMHWLRDAHAMEEQAEDMLAKTASRVADDSPEFASRLRDHASVSKVQAQHLRECIARLGGDTSALKDLAAKAVGTAQALSGLFTSDEVVKAALAVYTFDHMEIGSYRSLMAAAQVAGDPDTLRTCELHLAQEQEMALWMESLLPGLTQRFLQQSDLQAQSGR
jgi:ferritin-like metal-binding protein YciE